MEADDATQAQLALALAAQAGTNLLNEVDEDEEVNAVINDTNPTWDKFLNMRTVIDDVQGTDGLETKTIAEGLMDFVDALDNLDILDNILEALRKDNRLTKTGIQITATGDDIAPLVGGKKRRSSKKAKKTSKKSSKRKSSKKSKKSM